MTEHSVLANGIRVITECMPAVRSVSVGCWVDCGSRHEGEGQSGLSHLVEHMLFKGTARRTTRDIAMAMDMIGGVLNAFTGRDTTCYFAKLQSEHTGQALDLLADMLLHSQCQAEEFERERKVVLQEIGLIEDSPDDYIHDLLTASFWQGHPLGRPVIGTSGSIGALTVDDVLRFYRQHYGGQRLLIAAAGQVDHTSFVAEVERYFSSMPTGTPRAPWSAPTPHAGLFFHDRDLDKGHLCLALPGLPATHPDRFTLQVLNQILGGSMSSRLFQHLREERGLCYSIYSYLSSHIDAGSLAIYAGSNMTDMHVILAIVQEQLENLYQTPVEPLELRAAREQIKGALLLSLESSDNRMCRLARNQLYHGRHHSLEELVAGIDAVTADDLLRLSRTLFVGPVCNIQVVGNVRGLEDRIAASVRGRLVS